MELLEWYINIDWDNGLVPSVNMQLYELVLIQIYTAS